MLQQGGINVKTPPHALATLFMWEYGIHCLYRLTVHLFQTQNYALIIITVFTLSKVRASILTIDNQYTSLPC